MDGGPGGSKESRRGEPIAVIVDGRRSRVDRGELFFIFLFLVSLGGR